MLTPENYEEIRLRHSEPKIFVQYVEPDGSIVDMQPGVFYEVGQGEAFFLGPDDKVKMIGHSGLYGDKLTVRTAITLKDKHGNILIDENRDAPVNPTQTIGNNVNRITLKPPQEMHVVYSW